MISKICKIIHSILKTFNNFLDIISNKLITYNLLYYYLSAKMSDLNAFKKQLMTLQKKKSNFKLSERTVVEIVLKIINREKVNLLHTTSGKEYVVDGKANIEIINEIKKKKKNNNILIK